MRRSRRIAIIAGCLALPTAVFAAVVGHHIYASGLAEGDLIEYASELLTMLPAAPSARRAAGPVPPNTNGAILRIVFENPIVFAAPSLSIFT